MKKKNTLAALAGAVAALLATVFFLRRSRSDDKPSRSAPQVKIKNPGDQSEFTPAPTGERDLG